MNSFKRHIYKNNKVNKKVTLLTLDPTSATLSSSLPNDVVVQVSSNSSWSVGQIPDWFSITGGSGSGDGLFVIDTQNNNSNITRSHLLSVTAGEIGETVTRTFLITQQAFVPTLTLDPTSKDLLSVNPGNFVVDVISNTSWSVITTPPSWFSIIGGSGSGDGGFSITSIENNPKGPRSFELVVSTNTSNGSLGVTKTFTINQEGDLYPHYVAFDGTNEFDGCGAPPDTNVWSDSSTFQNSSILYRNGIGLLTVDAGFYSKENFFLQCNSEGVVINSDVCLIL